MNRDLLTIVGAGIGIWLVALIQWSHQPFFSTPIPDSDTALYWFLAKAIGKYGITFGSLPIFFSVYYAYLYFLFSFLGNPVKVAIFFNGILYICSLVGFVLLLKRIFNWQTAKIGGILFLLTKALLFYYILPIKTALYLTFFILFLLLITSEKSFFSGLVAGILSNIEGIFLGLLIIYLFFFLLQRRFRFILSLLISFTLSLSPIILLNLHKGNGFSISSQTSGIHFFIGNQQGATGVYKRAPGVRPNAFGHYYDAKRVAEREGGKKLTNKEVNAYWWKRGIKTITENPLSFIKLYFKKLLIFFNNYEIPNNYNLYLIAKKVWIIGLLPINFSVALFIGTLGFLIATKSGQRNYTLDIVLFTFPLILALFFITSRYRVIYYIPLLSYGALALNLLHQICKDKVFLKKALIISTLTLSVSSLPLLETIRAGYCRVFKWKTISTIQLRKAIKNNEVERIRRIFSKAKMQEINQLFTYKKEVKQNDRKRGWKRH